MKKWLSSSIVCFAMLAFTNLATAQIILVGNFSFEQPAITSSNAANPGSPQADWYLIATIGGTSYATIPDWTFAGGTATGIQNLAGPFSSVGSSQGPQEAWINVSPGSGGGTITYSGSGVNALPDIIAGENYTLTVAVGNRATEYGSPTGGEAGTDTLNLLAGAFTFTTTVDETEIPIGTFTDESVNLTAAEIAADGLAGQSLGIQLTGAMYGSDTGNQANFDNVRLTEAAVAPEPSAYMMMIGGLAFLGFLICRKRAQFSIINLIVTEHQ